MQGLVEFWVWVWVWVWGLELKVLGVGFRCRVWVYDTEFCVLVLDKEFLESGVESG